MDATNVVPVSYRAIRLPEELLSKVDALVASGGEGYSSTPEAVKEAIRRFLRREAAEPLDFRENLYLELAFLLQHTLDSTDTEKDPVQRLQEGLFTWRRERLGYDPLDEPPGRPTAR